MSDHIDPRHALDALHAIDPGCSRDEWHRIGRAAIAAGLSIEDVDAWSSSAANYRGTRDVQSAFRGITPAGGTAPGSLWQAALSAGWRPPQADEKDAPHHRPAAAPKPRQRPVSAQRGPSAAEAWKRFEPATAAHPYIVRKGAAGVPLDMLRVVPEGDAQRILGESMVGALVVPCIRADGSISTLQFIAPPETAARLKAKDQKTDKPNLPGAHLEGWFTVGELAQGGTAYLCEGIGTAWACWKATGIASVCCFGWSRVRGVAHAMRQRDPAARLVLVPDAGKEAEADAIASEVAGEFVTMPTGSPQNFDACDLAQRDGADALEVLLSSASKPAPPPMPFAVVPFADLATAEPPAPAFVWDGFIPAGHVTLLAAHGGTGKSMLALMLCVAVAMGLPLFGIPTRQGIAVFYSGEDGAALLRHRLRLVCRCMGVSVADLAGRLFIIDATDHDPTLFAEVTAAGRREGMATDTYASLRNFVAANHVSLVVVDNASDAFDANEIDRARVRGFMRALARIARERDAGVRLLAHVDKGISRGERSGTEGYSGSTAWHNSARSRLFMSRDKDGVLLLEHQKHTLSSAPREPLRLLWPQDGIPQVDEPMGPMVQGIADRNASKALLKLIAEFTARGEFVSKATTARTHAAKLLCKEPGYPKMKDSEVFDVLRRAERAGHLERVEFKGKNRHGRECWQVTAAGAAFAGIPAPTALTAPTSVVSAPDAESAEACADCADFGARGCGGNARAQEVGAEPAAGGCDAV